MGATTDEESDRLSGRARGKSIRQDVPRSSHGEWTPPADRPDPVELITSQNDDRLQFLLAIRHWRMAESPFAFYRGGAKVMAQDLAGTPVTGLQAQICGDAHLSNFGVYGSPERDLVFDLDDFDETLPGPWEWDLKRLGASFAIAARHNHYGGSDEIALASAAAKAYRRSMARFVAMGHLNAWYAHLDVEDIFAAFEDRFTEKERRAWEKFVRKARSKDSLYAFNKLAEEVDGRHRIAARPPLVIPLREMPTEAHPAEIRNAVDESFDSYLDSVPDHVGVLLRRFQYADLAFKIVGVGSVGTRCLIVLLEDKDGGDPFFLQLKEATRSVLEDHLPDSVYANHGQRVVAGQRLMQAASDSFLGWTQGAVSGAHFYWRQLKDMKGSVDIESASLAKMYRYADLCGWTLARAHARSGDSLAIDGYLGKSEVFDRAIGEFATAYADQNDRDYAAFTAAIDTGLIEAHE